MKNSYWVGCFACLVTGPGNCLNERKKLKAGFRTFRSSIRLFRHLGAWNMYTNRQKRHFATSENTIISTGRRENLGTRLHHRQHHNLITIIITFICLASLRSVHTRRQVAATCRCDVSPHLVAATSRPTCTHGVICRRDVLQQLVA